MVITVQENSISPFESSNLGRISTYKVNSIYLKVWTGDTFSQLPEQWVHYFLKFCRFNNIQDFFQFI